MEYKRFGGKLLVRIEDVYKRQPYTPPRGCAAGVLEASVNLERARSKFEMIRYKLHGSAGKTALTGEFYDRALL